MIPDVVYDEEEFDFGPADPHDVSDNQGHRGYRGTTTAW
jgi:hypothetical protein